MKRRNKFIANTFLLTAVSLGLRAVGVSFNVYIAGKIGAAGMGLFSLIMSVYNFGVTFACSGINLASTKIVSEEVAQNNDSGIKRAVKKSLVYALVFGGLAFTLVFFGADFAGNVILNDERTIKPLMILSLSLPCVSMSSAISGYFNAVGRVYKGAFVQVAEQFIRIASCVIILSNISSGDAEKACIAVVLSGCFAEFVSFFIIFIIYKIDILRYTQKSSGDNITRRILGVGIPIAISSYVRSGLSTIEHTLIPKGLKKHGGDKETALSAYGTVHGMVMPLIFFPSAVLQAFSSLLIPEFTMYAKKGSVKAISSLIENTLYITLAFSIGCSGILFFFAEEIGMATYKSREVVHFLKILSPLIALMYADGVVDAILKGLNQQVYSMGYNIFDSGLAIVLMIFLLPKKGIEGYIIIIYITEMVNAFLSINRLIHVANFKIRPLRWTAFPYICVFLVSTFAKSLYSGTSVLAAVLASTLYIVIMLMFIGTNSFKRYCKT